MGWIRRWSDALVLSSAVGFSYLLPAVAGVLDPWDHVRFFGGLFGIGMVLLLGRITTPWVGDPPDRGREAVATVGGFAVAILSLYVAYLVGCGVLGQPEHFR